MTTVTVTLDDPLDRFVRDQVASGVYATPQAVIEAGLRRVKDEAEIEAIKMERFLAAVQVGLDELDRGEGIVVTDLKTYFDEIEAEIEAEFADRAA